MRRRWSRTPRRSCRRRSWRRPRARHRIGGRTCRLPCGRLGSWNRAKSEVLRRTKLHRSIWYRLPAARPRIGAAPAPGRRGSPPRCATRSPTAACPPTPGCPATRLLAGQLGVSRGVVVEAYQRLTDEGLLGGRRGGGTTVLATAPTTAPVRSEAAPDPVPDRPAPGPARPVRVPAAGLAPRRTRRAGPHPGRRARLRRPARHPRAAHGARDVARRGPAGCAPTRRGSSS